MLGGSRRPHSYTDFAGGTFTGPEVPRETNHNHLCRKRHGGWSRRKEIAGLNLNPHAQNHSLRVVDEVWDEEYYRKSIEAQQESGRTAIGSPVCLLGFSVGTR